MLLRTHVVVLAGGSGTRFWPLSRRERPKQLLVLDGRDALLSSTFARIATLVPAERWWMAVGERYVDACRVAVPQVPADHVLVEPLARNTGPAVGLAAAHISAVDPEAVMIVLPADHHVSHPEALCAALESAAALAARGPIVTLGVRPTRPETGYGYIQRGDADARGRGAYRIKRFCEKPDLERAKGFVAHGGYDWNAGIFVMRAGTVMAELERQLPAVYAGLRRIRGALGTAGYAAALGEAFSGMSGISFDYGVMEGAADACVVPVSCGWSDVGSFNSLDAIIPRTAAGNIVSGRVIEMDTSDCVLHASRGQVLAVVGLSGVAVIQTPDATLVVPLSRAQEVREVLKRLGENGWSEFL